jgi:hypothetical protein
MFPIIPALIGATVGLGGRSLFSVPSPVSCVPSLPRKAAGLCSLSGPHHNDKCEELDSALKDARERVRNSGDDFDHIKLQQTELLIEDMKVAGSADWEFDSVIGDLKEIAKDGQLDIDTF